jgi:hypothetical protein
MHCRWDAWLPTVVATKPLAEEKKDTTKRDLTENMVPGKLMSISELEGLEWTGFEVR